MTSLIVTVAVARAVDAEAFGVFALGYLGAATVLSLARALVMQPLAIRHSLVGTEQHEAVGASATAALAIGGAAGLVTVAIGVVVGGDVAGILVVVGVCLPGMMLQDLYRFAAFSLGVPRKAAMNDLVWLVVQCVVTGAALVGDTSAATLTAAWGGAGCVAAAVGVVQIGIRPRRGARAFVRRHRDIGGAFAAEFLIVRGVGYLVVVCLVPLVGIAAVGGFRAVLTLYGPYTTLVFGTAAAMLSEGSRLLVGRPERFVRSQRLVGAGLAACAGVWGLVLVAMPSSWGHALLGDSWAYTQPLIVPVSVLQVAQGIAAASLMGLRVLAAGGTIVRLRVVASAATLVLGLLGAVGGVVPAAWGMAAASCILAVLASRALGHQPLAVASSGNPHTAARGASGGSPDSIGEVPSGAGSPLWSEVGGSEAERSKPIAMDERGVTGA